MRLRKQPIHPWDYVPTLQRNQFKLVVNLNTLITTRAPHTRTNLHLAAIVAKTIISISAPSCRQLWLLYHTGDIKEYPTVNETKTHNLVTAFETCILWIRSFVLTTLVPIIANTLVATQNFCFPFLFPCVVTLLTILPHKNKLNYVLLLLILEIVHLMSKVKPFPFVSHLT